MTDSGVTIYIVLAVALAVWAGVFFYLWRLDALARDLRRRLEQHPERETVLPPKATLERREK